MYKGPKIEGNALILKDEVLNIKMVYKISRIEPGNEKGEYCFRVYQQDYKKPPYRFWTPCDFRTKKQLEAFRNQLIKAL